MSLHVRYTRIIIEQIQSTLLADPNNIENPIFAYFWSLELGFGLT